MSGDKAPTQDQFLKDVATHAMSVKLDQGIYRHLDFRQADGSWNHGFHIITTPWRLIVTGDMGTWVFSRLEDMFCFFRTASSEINAHYWAEKCVNGVHGGSSESKVYNGDVYRQRLIDSLENYDLSAEHLAVVAEELKSLDFDDEYWIISQIRDFEVDLDGSEKFSFQDVHEVDMTVYSYHFIWCLHAIAWAIQQYDAVKVEQLVSL